MKNLLTFNEAKTSFMGNYMDVWPDLSYMREDWKSAYGISIGDQKELYKELQKKLGSKTPKLKDELRGSDMAEMQRKLTAFGKSKYFWAWSHNIHYLDIRAYDLNGEIVVISYGEWGNLDDSSLMIWTIEK